MTQNHLKKIVLALLLIVGAQGFAEVWGKIDFAPAYVHIDVLNDNQIVKKMDMLALKGDATIIVKDGFCLKPTVMYAANQGDLFTAGLSLGHCFPIADKWIITPTVGYSYTYIRTTFELKDVLTTHHFKERFRSFATNVGMEIYYQMTSCLRFCGQMQYAWSKTQTRIKHLVHTNGNARGPLFAAMMEYDFNDKVSANLGAAYNLSMSREKHGIRGYGAKAGLAYWF